MNMNKFLPAISVAAAIAISASAAMAVPLVGAPIDGPPTLPKFGLLSTAANSFEKTIFTHSAPASRGTAGYTTTGNGAFTLNREDGIAGTTTGNTFAQVAIPPNAAWIQPGVTDSFSEGAEWVSYAETGQGQNVATNDNVNKLSTFRFTLDIGNHNADFGFWVYADDTAEVFILTGAGNGIDDTGSANGTNDGTDDGRLRISLVKTPAQDGACAAAPIGCELSEQSFVEIFGLLANHDYTFEIDIYQRASGPTGLLFAGGFNNVPEPGTLALLGLGVLGFGVARRRRKAA